MKINRKKFFQGLAVGTVSLPFAIKALLGDKNLQAQQHTQGTQYKKYSWKMVTTWPPNSPALDESCKLFAKWVNEMSNGRLDIQVYAGGELVPPLGTFDAVKSGSAEMGSGASYYWAGKIPAAQFFASIPFGMNAWQLNTWMSKGGGMELWQELYAQHNLVPFMVGNTGVQAGGWFNKAINTVDDLKGLKMRIPGLGGKVLEKAGGTPVLLPGGELYTGLERGIIDATEWLGPYHDYKAGFHEIAKHYYYPGWHEPGTSLELIINKEKYDELPADLKAIIVAAAARTHHWFTTEMEYQNVTYLQKLEAAGVDIGFFPQPVLDQLKIYTEEAIQELIASDSFAQKVYKSYSEFRTKANIWSTWTEEAYYNKL